MKFKLQLVVIIFIAFAAGYFFGTNKVTVDWKYYKPVVHVVNQEPPAGISTVDFSQFWNVWEKVSTNYYDKKVIDPQKMLNGAISGMVSSLGDPYTMYLPPAANTSFQQQLAGKFEGIGAELGLKDKQIIVVAPLAGSPSEKAGVRAGDSVLKVNGESMQGWTLQQAVEKIRGPKGTQVVITILHKDTTSPKDVTITRDTITVKSVNGWVKNIKDIDGISTAKNLPAALDKKIAYIRLSQFGDETNKDFLALVNSLQSNISDPAVKGLILDLRNNPGGYVTDATFIAGEFLPLGTPVVIQEIGSGDDTTLTVNRKGNLYNIPLIILINRGSASASEIVAGAMRDNKRAKLVGEQSFGKGTMQQAIDLGAGAGLHVTIAKWLTPSKIWVHGVGLTPDFSAALDEKDPSHDTQLDKAIQVLLQ